MGVCLEDVVKRQNLYNIYNYNLQDQTPECKGFLNKMEFAEKKTILLSEQKSILKWNSLQY